MNRKLDEVSSFQAKTRLSELLRETERGRSFVISRRGKSVARLVPAADKGKEQDVRQVLASLREIRKRIRGRLKVRRFIGEGRRF